MNTITKPKINLRTACKELLMSLEPNSTSKQRADAIYSAMMNKGARNTKMYLKQDVADIVALAREMYFT